MFDIVELGGMKTVASKAATNHVYLVDVSGSMHQSLPLMRQHLKNIVSMIAQPDDTFSIIYFSGRGQCGVVCEGVPVNDLASVTSVQNAIDRWLQPIGLTGFAEPIALAHETAKRLSNGKFNNFVMLTDGYDNQSNRTNIIDNVRMLPEVFHSTSFIEYGWYCDRPLLARMAEACGGLHVFAECYDHYETVFDEVVRDAVRDTLIEVKVNKRAQHAIYLLNTHIIIADVKEGTVSVPESVERVHSIVPGDVLQKHLSDDHLYLILYYAVKISNTKLAWRCLEALGDVRMVDQYTNAFTRQEITDFLQLIETAVILPEARFVKGQDFNYVPPENAPTVLDALSILSDNDVQVVVDSPYFEYTRTGVRKTPSEELPKFIRSPNQMATVTGLTYHSSRPNVSLQTLVNGTVELPDNDFDLKRVPSVQWKNYTVIRDGILNIHALPVIVDYAVADRLRGLGKHLVDLVEDHGEKQYVVLDLDSLPVINRKMTSDVDLAEFAKIVRGLLLNQAFVKGLKSCLSQKDGKAEGLADKYGQEAASWLSSIGVRDYGFSPKVESSDSVDVYYSTELEYKVKGLNTLPSANAVQKKLDADKSLTVGEYLVSHGMQNKAARNDKDLKDLIKITEAGTRGLQQMLSSVVYAMVLGKSWFDGVEEEVASTSLKFDNYSVPMTVSVVRKEVKI
jgi:hypothetical protein